MRLSQEEMKRKKLCLESEGERGTRERERERNERERERERNERETEREREEERGSQRENHTLSLLLAQNLDCI